MVAFGGCGFRRFLASSSSIAALIAGTILAPQAADAACPTSITGASPGCTNAATITGINAHGATVTSSIVNTGTISTNGISLNTNSTLSGGITDSGALTGGIGIDATSQVTASGSGISVQNTTSLSGGISNGGTVSAFQNGIAVSVTSFGGGITNAGTVLGGITGRSAAFGIDVRAKTFSGGILNTGTISGHLLGLALDNFAFFSGGISNTGNISGVGGTAIYVDGLSTFSGGITNSGALSGRFHGIEVTGPKTFAGNIANNGSITSGQTGILVGFSSSFTGNISSTGTISASGYGIHLIASTIYGQIAVAGQVLTAGSAGIYIDNNTSLSAVISTNTAIKVSASTFAGGISNSGTISAANGQGIRVTTVSTFAGGITNSATITSANSRGIWIDRTTSFSGIILNQARASITAQKTGILVSNVSSFAQGVWNDGTILAGRGGTGSGIAVSEVSTFRGGILNSGTVSAAGNGIAISQTGVAASIGNLLNATIASANANGIAVQGVDSFDGAFNMSLIKAVNGVGILIGGASGAQAVGTLVGSVENTGTISAPTGILVEGVSLVLGSIYNDEIGGTVATISGNIVVRAVSQYAAPVSNAGVIATGITIGGTVSTQGVSTFSGQIINTGQLSGGAGPALLLDHIGIFSGLISNLNGATIGNGGIQPAILLQSISAFSGSVSNGGTISGGTGGIVLRDVTNFSGTIANSGMVSAPSGTAISVQNGGSFSGGITNSGGTIAGANGIRVIGVSSFIGSVANSGTIILASVLNPAGIAVANAIVFGTNTPSGGIVNSGTVTGGAFGIIAGATSIHGPGISTFLGGITNTGTLSAAGHGIALQNISDFSGGISNSGLIAIGATGIRVGATGTFTGGITNSGMITGGQFGGIRVINVSSFSGDIVNAGTISLSAGHTPTGIALNLVSLFQGSISNTGTISASKGIVIGQSSIAGGAIVNSGTIQGNGGTAIDLSNALSPVVIQQDGGTILGTILFSSHGDTLSGNGTVVGNITQGNATIAPGLGGNNVLKISGNLTQGAASNTVIEVSPAAAAQVNVTGTAALAGGLTLVFDPGSYLNKTYDLIHAGTVAGAFASSTSINAPSGSAQTLLYTATDVDLALSSLTVTTPTGAFGDAGSIALSGAAGSDDIVFDHLDEQQFGRGADQVKTALAGAAPMQIAMNGKLQQLAQAGTQLPSAIAQYGGWVRGIGNFLDVDNAGTASGFSASGGGFLAGIDHPFGLLTLGIAGGFTGMNFAQNDGESGYMQTLRGMLYAHYRADPQIIVDGVAGLAYDRIHTSRPITSLGSNATESHNAYESSLALQAGYVMPWQGFTLIPHIGAQYVHLAEDGFTETGGSGFDLSRSHESVDSFQPSIGVSVLEPFTLDNGMQVTPQFKLAYSHELLNPSETLALTAAGGSVVPASVVTPAHNTVTLGPSTTLRLNDRVNLFADYKLAIGVGTSIDQIIAAGARFTW